MKAPLVFVFVTAGLLASCSGSDGVTDTSGSSGPDLTSQLVAWYPFNGNANDSIGQHHGTVSGAILTSDRFGNPNRAYSFDGIDDYVLCGDILDDVFCAPVARFTVAGWAKTRTAGTTYSGGGFIVGKVAGGTYGPYQWNLSHLDTRVFGLVSADTAAQNYVNRTHQTTTGTWFHFALIFDGSLSPENRVKIYVNARSEMDTYASVGTLGTTTANSSQHLTIGASHQAGAPLNPGNAYDGLIDDIRVYSRVLTSTEIQALYLLTE